MAKKRGNGEGTIVKRTDGRWMASLTLGRDAMSGKLKRVTFYLGSAYTDLDLVFCRPDGTPLDPKWMNRTFARLLRRAGLPPMRFHGLRHTFATLLMQLGESHKTVSQLLGHAGVQIPLDWYTHPSQQVEEQTIARLSRALGGQE